MTDYRKLSKKLESMSRKTIKVLHKRRVNKLMYSYLYN